MTRAAFDVQMTRLIGLKFPPAELNTHWEALQDMEDDVLTAAVSKAQKEADEFPSPRMLRMLGDIIRAKVRPVGPEPDRSVPAEERSVTLPGGKVLKFTREWPYDCLECSDTGWRSFVCGRDVVQQGRPEQPVSASRNPWVESLHCGRDGDHVPHTWSEACPCRDTNRSYQRKRERAIQMAAQRVKARGDAA